jgi:hypothetical protein
MNRRFRLPLLAPVDTAEVSGSSGGEDLTGLKSALAAERKAREKAERTLQDLQTQQELSNKTLAEQVATLQGQLVSQTQTYESEKSQLAAQLSQRDIRSAFVSAYGGAKGLPEYADVLYAHLGSQLQLSDGKVLTTDGKALSEAIAHTRTQFPAMFAPDNVAAGSGLSASAPQSNGSLRVVKASDGVSGDTVNPLDMASGKVVLDLTN